MTRVTHGLLVAAMAGAQLVVAQSHARAAPAPDLSSQAAKAPIADITHPGAALVAAPNTTHPNATPAPQVGGEEAIVEQPRPFGYVLGDTLIQRVFLAPEFQLEALPPLERAGLWFARRSAILKHGDDGRRWLIMDYQLVNAPQTLMTVNLPAMTLKSKAGKVMTVPMWPISVAPLTPQHAFAKGGLQELRPDHPAPKVPTSTLRRQVQIWQTAFTITVAAWLACWVIRSIRSAANQPFARALREVRQAGDDSPEAWLALHRAFDRTAGRVLQTSTLPTLFKQAPHLAAERGAIEQFYNQSNLRFFGGVAINGPALDLLTLAATLRRLEKQHER